MKGGSDIISGIHCIKQAHEHFKSFTREHPGTKGAKLMDGYCNRLAWFPNDLITHPALPESVREGIKQEWNSDVFALPALFEKIPLLNPEQRELVEKMVDAMLQGEEITVADYACGFLSAGAINN